MSDTTHDPYWRDYTNLQQAKHALIRRYLGGWFAKLGSWASRVLYIDTHAGRGKGLEQILDDLFVSTTWRERITAASPDDRADQAINLLAETFGGRWRTYLRMLGDNGATRSVLVHLTNDDRGRDLRPLEAWVLDRLRREETTRWKDLLEAIRPEVWMEKHVNEVVRGLRRKGRVDSHDPKGSFSAKANPVLFLR